MLGHTGQSQVCWRGPADEWKVREIQEQESWKPTVNSSLEPDSPVRPLPLILWIGKPPHPATSASLLALLSEPWEVSERGRVP